MLNVIAQFQTTLTTGISSSALGGTLESNASADADGGTLPNGDYGIVIDEGNNNREYASITLTGFDFVFIKRGLSVIDGNTVKTGNQQAHRKGAVIKIVNHPVLARIVSVLNGVLPVTEKLIYDAAKTFSDPLELISKGYADALAIAGAPDASTTVKGLVEVATTTEAIDGTDTGGTGASLAVLPSDVAKNAQNSAHQYALSTDDYVPAFLTGGNGAQSTFATWAAIANGSFRLTVDGTAYNIDAIDFTGDASMADVAATIQAAIRTVTGGLETCTWSVNHFIISSGDTVPASSAIAVLETSTGTVGTDISGAGVSAWMDSNTGNGTVTNKVLTGYVLTLVPAIVAYAAGQSFKFKASVANGGAMTLNVDSLGTKNIYKKGSSALEANDIIIGAIVEVVYDGTQFQMINQQSNIPTTAILNELISFFGSTDITGAEAETLTDGSDAESLHTHSPYGAGAKVLGAGEATVVKTYWNFEIPFILYSQSDSSTPKFVWTATSISTANMLSVGVFTWLQRAASDTPNRVLTTLPIMCSPTLNNPTDGLEFGSGKKVIVEFGVQLNANSNENQGFGLIESFEPFSIYNEFTVDAVCFTLDGAGGLYAHCANKTVASTEVAITGITISNMNTFRIEFDPGVDAKFYVNGVLKATITTNLPSTADILFGWGSSGDTNQEGTRLVTAPRFAVEK